jgi:transposase
VRGDNHEQDYIFSYHSLADRVPMDHPLRLIKEIANRALKELSKNFAEMYAPTGRPSIPPEKMIRGLLLQVLYSIRSERMLMEQLDYNLLFRWFVGLSMDEEVWDHSTFSKNRERLLNADIVRKFFERIREQAQKQGLLSDEHFTVDGTLIEAWASQKSFQPKAKEPKDPGESGRNPEVNFRDKTRSNKTHESTTDPDARLLKKSAGGEARLSYMGHVLLISWRVASFGDCGRPTTPTNAIRARNRIGFFISLNPPRSSIIHPTAGPRVPWQDNWRKLTWTIAGDRSVLDLREVLKQTF